MSFEQAKALLDDLFIWLNKDYANSKIFKYTIGDHEANFELLPINLDFFGGECTLHIGLIKQICQYFEDLCDKYGEAEIKNSYTITIQTNGTTFFNPEVNEFYHKYASRLEIPISIDGCKDCHNACRKYVNGQGSYDDVEKAILAHNELMHEAPNSKLTFSPENMQYIPQAVRTLSRLGYTAVRSSFDITRSSSREESEQYYKYLTQAIDYIIDNKIKFYFNWFWPENIPLQFVDDRVYGPMSSCGANGSQIVLNYNGNLSICAQLSEATVSKDKAILLGNVQDGITTDGMAQLTEFRQFKRNIPLVCLKCPLRFLCDDCPARNLIKKGTIEDAAPNCGATLAEARASIYFATRAKETEYPYFKEQVEKILKYIKYESDREYLIDEEEK